jgi:hypothetical protein
MESDETEKQLFPDSVLFNIQEIMQISVDKVVSRTFWFFEEFFFKFAEDLQ